MRTKFLEVMKGSPCNKLVVVAQMVNDELEIDFKEIQFDQGYWMSQRNAFLTKLGDAGAAITEVPDEDLGVEISIERED